MILAAQCKFGNWPSFPSNTTRMAISVAQLRNSTFTRDEVEEATILSVLGDHTFIGLFDDPPSF